MISDKELADKVVALGVGRHPVMLDLNASCFQENKELYSLELHMGRSSAEQFVRDWRVAGALLEKMITGELTVWRQAYDNDSPIWIVETHLTNADGRNESLPRAINEACVEALTQPQPNPS